MCFGGSSPPAVQPPPPPPQLAKTPDAANVRQETGKQITSPTAGSGGTNATTLLNGDAAISDKLGKKTLLGS